MQSNVHYGRKIAQHFALRMAVSQQNDQTTEIDVMNERDLLVSNDFR